VLALRQGSEALPLPGCVGTEDALFNQLIRSRNGNQAVGTTALGMTMGLAMNRTTAWRFLVMSVWRQWVREDGYFDVSTCESNHVFDA
jgi:hypothetical protein